MKMQCPHLRLGSGVHENAEYACVLTRAVVTYIPIKGREMLFYAGEQLLAKLSREGRLEILAWYACDGYSPTIRFFGGWLRITPIPRKAGYFPAIFHDFTRQFLDTEGCPWHRDQSDAWFYDALVAGGESPHIAGTYYGAVSRTLGNIWTRLTHKLDPTLWIREVKSL